MNELVVVTYKRPADELDKKRLLSPDMNYVYDCTAFHNDELSKPEITKLSRKYSDVESFVCNFASYYDWVNNEARYSEFERTGECPIKPIDEDIDVGVTSKTVTIDLYLRLEREDPNSSFNYKVDVDEVDQIVLTPTDVGTQFVPYSENMEEDEFTKIEHVVLTAQMISDVNDYDYFIDIDEVGQLIITPEKDETSFLSVSVNDSLNLVTEEVNEIIVDSEHTAPFQIGDRVVVHLNGNDRPGVIIDYHDPMNTEICCGGELEARVVRFDDDTQDIVGTQYLTLENVTKENEVGNMKFLKESRDWEWNREELYAVIKDDGTYAGVPCLSYEEARDLSYHEGSRIFKLVLLSDDTQEDSIDEELDDKDIDTSKILSRFMKGDIALFSMDEGEPGSDMVHIDKLDNTQGKVKYEYYYDKETDSVVSYARNVTD